MSELWGHSHVGALPTRSPQAEVICDLMRRAAASDREAKDCPPFPPFGLLPRPGEGARSERRRDPGASGALGIPVGTLSVHPTLALQ